jgi:hypothetical protein
VLFERVLCPVDRAEDRGIQEAAIPLVEDGGGLLVLGVASFGGGDPSRDWGFWTGIEFD